MTKLLSLAVAFASLGAQAETVPPPHISDRVVFINQALWAGQTIDLLQMLRMNGMHLRCGDHIFVTDVTLTNQGRFVSGLSLLKNRREWQRATVYPDPYGRLVTARYSPQATLCRETHELALHNLGPEPIWIANIRMAAQTGGLPPPGPTPPTTPPPTTPNPPAPPANPDPPSPPTPSCKRFGSAPITIEADAYTGRKLSCPAGWTRKDQGVNHPQLSCEFISLESDHAVLQCNNPTTATQTLADYWIECCQGAAGEPGGVHGLLR